MGLIREVSEGLARKTTRRGLFGRGADIVFGALTGAAAGTVVAARTVSAGPGTLCAFPGPPCPCQFCGRAGGGSNGICAKPCLILTQFYASGCWVAGAGNSITCCDCDCHGINSMNWCGCGSDYHTRNC